MQRFLVLSSRGTPRRLIPLGSRRATISAVLRGGGGTSLKQLAQSRALAAALATGLGQVCLRDRFTVRPAPDARTDPATPPTVEDYLGDVLREQIFVSLRLGPPRANLKPVLQVFGSRGSCLAFAKIGINELTTSLVTHERQVLADLQGKLTHTEIPQVLHFGDWAGLSVLVLSPLTVSSVRRRPSPALVLQSMVEIAGSAGIRPVPLQDSRFAADLRSRLEQIEAGDDDGFSTAPLRRALADDATETFLFGRWHGDWHAGNMAASAGNRLVVWDWERSTPEVPLGLDALHLHLHTRLLAQRLGRPQDAIASVRAHSARLLEPFGVPHEQSAAVARLYFTEILSRYLLDGQASGPAWRPLLEAIAAELDAWTP